MIKDHGGRSPIADENPSLYAFSYEVVMLEIMETDRERLKEWAIRKNVWNVS